MKRFFNSLEYNCLLYLLFICLPFLVTIYKLGFLMYSMLLINYLKTYDNSFITEYLYTKNVLKDIKYYRLINFVSYNAMVIPFSYIGFFNIHYLFATIFISIIYVSKMYSNYIKNKHLLKFTLKDNELVKIENYPSYLQYNVIKKEEPSNNIDDNILNIIMKGPVTVENIKTTKIYKNIYISHENNFTFEIDFQT